MAGGVRQNLSLGQALAASVLSGFASDELPNERGAAHGCPVGRHSRIFVRGVSHEYLRATIGRVSQRLTGLPAANAFRPHADSMHLGLAAFMVLVSAARGHIWRARSGAERVVPSMSTEAEIPPTRIPSVTGS